MLVCGGGEGASVFLHHLGSKAICDLMLPIISLSTVFLSRFYELLTIQASHFYYIIIKMSCVDQAVILDVFCSDYRTFLNGSRYRHDGKGCNVGSKSQLLVSGLTTVA